MILVTITLVVCKSRSLATTPLIVLLTLATQLKAVSLPLSRVMILTRVPTTLAIPAKDVCTTRFSVTMRMNVQLTHAIPPAVALTNRSRVTMVICVP